MAITNPYPNADSMVQTRIPNAVRVAIRTVAPYQGATFTILNNLIKNFISDYAELNALSAPIVDYADVLSILLERRPLTPDQLTRLRSTSLSSAAAGLQPQPLTGSADRTGEVVADNGQGSPILQSGTTGRKRQPRKKEAKDKEGGPTSEV